MKLRAARPAETLHVKTRFGAGQRCFHSTKYHAEGALFGLRNRELAGKVRATGKDLIRVASAAGPDADDSDYYPSHWQITEPFESGPASGARDS